MSNLGYAEITLRLNQTEFRATLASVPAQVASALAKAEVAAANAGKATGAAYGANAARAVSASGFSASLQAELNKSASIFRAAGAAAGKAYVADLVNAIDPKKALEKIIGAFDGTDSKLKKAGSRAGKSFANSLEAETAGIKKKLASTVSITDEAKASGAAIGSAIASGIQSATPAISAPISSAILLGASSAASFGAKAGSLFGAAIAPVSRLISIAVAAGFSLIGSVAQAAGSAAGNLFAAGISAVGGAIKNVLASAFAAPISGVSSAAKQAGQLIAATLRETVGVGTIGLLSKVFDGLGDLGKKAGEQAGRLFGAGLELAKPLVAAALQLVFDASIVVASKAGEQAGKLFSAGLEAAKPLVIRAIEGLLRASINIAKETGAQAGKAFSIGFELAKPAVAKVLSSLFSAGLESARQAGNKAGQLFLTGVAAITPSIIKALGGAFLGVVAITADSARKAAESFTGTFRARSPELAKAIEGGFTSITNTAQSIGKRAGQLYTAGVALAKTDIRAVISKSFLDTVESAAAAGANAARSFAAAMKSAAGAVAGTGLGSTILGGLDAASAGLKAGGEYAKAAKQSLQVMGAYLAAALESDNIAIQKGAKAGKAFADGVKDAAVQIPEKINAVFDSTKNAAKSAGIAAGEAFVSGVQATGAAAGGAIVGGITGAVDSATGAIVGTELAQGLIGGFSGAIAALPAPIRLALEVAGNAALSAGRRAGVAFLAGVASVANSLKTALYEAFLASAEFAFRSGINAGKSFAAGVAGAIAEIRAAILRGITGDPNAGRGAGILYSQGIKQGLLAGSPFTEAFTLAAIQAARSGAAAGQGFAAAFVAMVRQQLTNNLFKGGQFALPGAAERPALPGAPQRLSLPGTTTEPIAGAPSGAAAGGAYGQAFNNAVAASMRNITAQVAAMGALNTGLGTDAGGKYAAGFAASMAQVEKIGAINGSAYTRSFVSATANISGLASNIATGAGNGFGSNFIQGARSTLRAGFNLGTWLKAGVGNIGRSIGQQVGGQITASIGTAVIGLGGKLLDTKNFGEADKAARKVGTLAPTQIKEYQGDAQAISKKLRYGVTSTEVQAGQYQALSSGFNKKTDVNPLIENAAKLSIISGGDASLKDTTAALSALSNILKDSGFDGKGKQPLNLQKDGGRVGSLVSGFVDASVGFDESLTSRSIGKLTAPGTRSQLDPYELLGVAAQASKTLTAGNVTAGLPQLIASIEKRSKPSEVAAASLGYKAGDQTEGFNAASLSKKGLIPFLEDLKVKLAAVEAKGGVGAKNEALTKLFGNVQARRVAGAALDDIGGTKEATGVIRNANIDDKLAITQEGLIAKQTAFTNSLKELDIQIKQGLVGTVLTQAFSGAAAGVKFLGDALTQLNQWFVGLDPTTKALVEGVGQVAVVVGTTVAAVVAFGAAWAVAGGALTAGITLAGAIATGFATMAIALAPVLIPLVAIGAAVYALATAFGATNTQAFTAAMVAVGVGLAAAFGPAILGAVAAGTVALVTGFGSIAIAATAALIPLLPWIAGAVAIAAGLYLLYKAFEAAKPTLEAWWQAIVSATKQAWDATVAFATGAVTAVVNWVKGVVDGIAAVINWYVQLYSNIGKFLLAIVQAMIGFVDDFTRPLRNAISRGLAILGEMVSVGVARVLEFVSGVVSAIGSAARFIYDFIAGIITGYWRLVGQIASAIGSWIAKQEAVRAVVRTVAAGIEAFKNICVSAFNGVVKLGIWMGESLTLAFNRIIEGVKASIDWVSKLPGLFGSAANAINLYNNTRPTQQAPPPPPPQPQNVSSLPSSPEQTGSTSGIPSGFGGGFAIGAAIASKFREAIKTGIASGGGALVNASEFNPGGGGDEGRQEDIRSRRLLPSDFAVATPLAGKNSGIPYGTTVRVTNPANNKSVEAIARDGGPYVPGRQLDLTTAVARAIGFKGLGTLKLEIVKLPNGATQGTYYTGEASKLRRVDSVAAQSGLQVPFVGQQARQSSTPSLAVSSPIANKTLAQAINPVYADPNLERYGADRQRPGRGLVKGDHRGTDYNAGVGTEVLAAFDGVAKAVDYGRTGVAIELSRVLDNGTTITAKYLHLSQKTFRLIQQNQSLQVRAGQPVGYVGIEGYQYRGAPKPTGSQTHLHFEGKVNGQEQDPTRFLSDLANGKYGAAQATQSITGASIGAAPNYSAAPGLGGSSYAETPREIRPYKQYITRPGTTKLAQPTAVEPPQQPLAQLTALITRPAAKSPAVSVVVPTVTVELPDLSDPTAGTTAPAFVIPKIVKAALAVKKPKQKPVKPVAKPVAKSSPASNIVAKKPVKKAAFSSSSESNYDGTGFSKEQILGTTDLDIKGRSLGVDTAVVSNNSATNSATDPTSKNAGALADRIKSAEADLAAALQDQKLLEATDKRRGANYEVALRNAQADLKRAEQEEKSAPNAKKRAAANRRKTSAQQRIERLNNGGNGERQALASSERVRKAQERLDNLKAKAPQAEGKDAEATRRSDLERLSAEIEAINSQSALVNSQIDRDAAAKPEGKTQATIDKADVSGQQAAALDRLLPKVAELQKKYPDQESRKTLDGITTSINSQAIAAANAATEIAKIPLAELTTKIDTMVAAAKGANDEADSSVVRDPSKASAVQGEKADRLAALQADLATASDQADQLSLALQDADSIKALDAIQSKLREVGIEAYNARKAAEATKVGNLSAEATTITQQSDKRTQGVNIAALEGTINAAEKEEALLFVRKLAAQQLDEVLPKLQAVRDAATDPALIEAANEQIAKILQYKAEVTATAIELKKTQYEASALGHTSKLLTTTLDEGFRSVLKDSLNGFRSLGSILDGILNKIADSAINIGIDALLGSSGGGGKNKSGDFIGTLVSGAAKIFGFNEGGVVENIPNYAAGGTVANFTGLSKAVSLYQGIEAAKKKEGNRAVTIVANENERILTARQAAVYEAMLRDGTVANAEQIYGYYGGGGVSANGARHTATQSAGIGSGDSPRSVQVEVTRINEIDYVSMSQLQAILNHQLPLTARAGAAITDQNLSNTAYRSQYGIK